MEKTSVEQAVCEQTGEAKSVKALLLLSEICNPFLTPRIEEFSAKEFENAANKKGGVNIAHLSPCFLKYYGTKTESITRTKELYGYKVAVDQEIKEIIDFLGGPSWAIVGLFDIFKKIERQPDGQYGRHDGLATDGRINTFLVPDINGDIRPVRVVFSEGWHILVSLDKHSQSCSKGTRFFSHELAV